jgi:RNA polymerase sigma factor
MKQFNNKKLLPIKELTLLSGVNRKTVEKGRKYIIALALIHHYEDEFIYLRSYISL